MKATSVDFILYSQRTYRVRYLETEAETEDALRAGKAAVPKGPPTSPSSLYSQPHPVRHQHVLTLTPFKIKEASQQAKSCHNAGFLYNQKCDIQGGRAVLSPACKS
jgi:hypothetical protein